jgi:hypothetical protein
VGVRLALLTQRYLGCGECFIDFAVVVFDLTVFDVFGTDTGTGTGRCWELGSCVGIDIVPVAGKSSGRCSCISDFTHLRPAQNLFNVFASGVDAVIVLVAEPSVKKGLGARRHNAMERTWISNGSRRWMYVNRHAVTLPLGKG